MSDPISVTVSFTPTRVVPVMLFYKNKTIKVARVNLVHHERHGRDKVYFFSVSDAANMYRLRFSTETLAWTLEEVVEL